MKCRFCENSLAETFLDLGNCPLSNSFLSKEQLNKRETFYPLKLYVCEKCWLVQIDEYKSADEIFNKNYAYFSSYSQTWLEHARNYVNMIVEKLYMSGSSRVIEIASNDGYLLQYFKQKQIECFGIEPSANVAELAEEKGIPVIVDFFGARLAKQLSHQEKTADLIIGNNVFAHVPDLNDFVVGLKLVLKADGVITLEFPYLMHLIEQNQFDTIYHEHFSYFSFYTVKLVLENHGLEVFDVEQIHTHGGSLRIYGKHREDASKSIADSVGQLLEKEKSKGMQTLDYYKGFQARVDKVKDDLVSFLVEQKRKQKKVVAYGAAAKGNTLLNYCGIGKDLLSFAADASPYKQGKYLPGSHIPVVNEEEIKKSKPAYVLILPWNIKEEIMSQLDYICSWDGQFVVPIPHVGVI